MADLQPLLVTPEQAREIADALAALRNVRGAGGVSVSYAPGGGLVIAGGGKGAASAGGAVIRRMVVKSIQNDYLVCRSLDQDDAEASVDIPVAKPPELRHDEDWYPNVTALSTVSTQSVTATIGGEDETWILPDELVYVANTTQILAVRCGKTGVQTTGSDEIFWMDLNNAGRVWIKDDS